MISNRTRQKWQNRFGLFGVGGLVLTLRMFFLPELSPWIPGTLLAMLATGIVIGYAIFPRSISRWDRNHTSDIGVSIERVWFAVACGIGIWAVLAAGLAAVLVAIGFIFAPVSAQNGVHQTESTQRH